MTGRSYERTLHTTLWGWHAAGRTGGMPQHFTAFYSCLKTAPRRVYIAPRRVQPFHAVGAVSQRATAVSQRATAVSEWARQWPRASGAGRTPRQSPGPSVSVGRWADLSGEQLVLVHPARVHLRA